MLSCAGAGDVCERTNAALGPHGAVSQYMHPTNREARLERMAFHYQQQVDDNLAGILVTMGRRADQVLADAAAEREECLSKLCALLLEEGVPAAEVRHLPVAAAVTMNAPCNS